MSNIDRHQGVIRRCLDRLHSEFVELEQQGSHTTVVDRETDFSTKADKRLSRSLRDFFRSRSETYTLLSEESEIGDATLTDWVVIADEIDGTANMINGGENPFGPIIAIARKQKPCFNDIVAMGFLSLSSGDLYEAYKDDGAFLRTGWAHSDATNNVRRLSASSREELSEKYPQILVDQYMLSGRPELADLCWTVGYPGDFRSWAYHMALVARGTYDLAITGDYCTFHEGKHATAEEVAGGYLLVTESGGTVTTWQGDKLGAKSVGMCENKTFDTIVAGTDELAIEFSTRLCTFINSHHR